MSVSPFLVPFLKLSMAASSCGRLPLHHTAVTCCGIFLSLITLPCMASGCFNSLISFGDSLSDTGNSIRLFPPDKLPNFGFPPFGRTFFHRPTGRCSDGRLVIDFVAESLGLPLVPPYVVGADVRRREFGEGVNFAVVGATALSVSFFRERGISFGFTNVSLDIELQWFKQMLVSSCQRSSEYCKEFLRSSLIIMGEIGGNDYYNALMDGRSVEEIKTFVPTVVDCIGSAINELIELGAVTLVVPGYPAVGCIPVYLEMFHQASDSTEYDSFGCIKSMNELSKYHNNLLQIQLSQLGEHHPRANIIYADYYNAMIGFYSSPNKFGFRNTSVLEACCGDGGLYNYNPKVACGEQPSTCCDDPSLYVSWDGLHLTEAAYRWIARGILEGPFANPSVNTVCNSQSVGGFFVS